MPGEMGLVVEPGGGRDVPGRQAFEEQVTGEVDPAAREVLVRCHSELAAEGTDQVCRVGVQQAGCLIERDPVDVPVVEQVPQPVGKAAAVGTGDRGQRLLPQVPVQPLVDEREQAFGRQFLAGGLKGRVQGVDLPTQPGIVQGGAVDGESDEALSEDRRVEVQDSFAESLWCRRRPVVRHVRRQERHQVVQRAVLVPVQFVPDHPVIDEEQGPRVMRVHGIAVVGETGVEHLDDSPHGRAPGPDLRASDHARIVQDSAVPAWKSPTMESTPVRFDTKIAVLLRDDLQSWQRLNVTAFLVSGISTVDPEVIGEPYADADDTEYLPMFRQPVLVFAGSKETLTLAHTRAVGRALPLSVFTSDLFSTGHDGDNRAAVRAVPKDHLDLVGLAVYGPKNAVDKVLKGARMHT